MYSVMDFSDEDKKRLPDADAYEKEAKAKIAASPFGDQIAVGLRSLKFTAGEAKIDGDTASVPITLTAQGQSFTIPMEMVNKGGWKVKQGGAMAGGGMGGMMGR